MSQNPVEQFYLSCRSGRFDFNGATQKSLSKCRFSHSVWFDPFARQVARLWQDPQSLSYIRSALADLFKLLPTHTCQLDSQLKDNVSTTFE